MTNNVQIEKRSYGIEDVAQVYGMCEKVAGKLVRRIRVVLYPPTSTAEKDNHPLPTGRVFATDLPAFEEKMRALKGREENAG